MTIDHQRYAEAIVPLYSRAFDEFGDDTRAVFLPKGRQTLRYTHMLAGLEFESVLDVGCGLGSLKTHLDATGRAQVRYVGVDIVPAMVNLCRAKFPTAELHCVERADAVEGVFDVVFVSGTFNIIPEGFTTDAYKAFVFDTLASLFGKARRYLVFDYMHDRVDFTQRGALHLSHAETIAFVTTRLSRRFELRQHYMPYESALRVYVDDTIDRERNVFAAATGESGK
jgi:SAM-dependent methyltransferase